MMITMNRTHNFDQLLESSVVANWADLMGDAPRGLIHVEYDFTASGALDYLQVWSCIVRGRWLLVLGYQRAASEFNDTGVHFHNGYQSEDLARILDLMILHQKAFTLPPNLGRAGLLQVTTPTQKDSAAAAVSINDALDLINSASAEPVLA